MKPLWLPQVRTSSSSSSLLQEGDALESELREAVGLRLRQHGAAGAREQGLRIHEPLHLALPAVAADLEVLQDPVAVRLDRGELLVAAVQQLLRVTLQLFGGADLVVGVRLRLVQVGLLLLEGGDELVGGIPLLLEL